MMAKRICKRDGERVFFGWQYDDGITVFDG